MNLAASLAIISLLLLIRLYLHERSKARGPLTKTPPSIPSLPGYIQIHRTPTPPWGTESLTLLEPEDSPKALVLQTPKQWQLDQLRQLKRDIERSVLSTQL